MIGYGRQPDFELFGPNQWTHEQRIAYVMKYNPILREAQRKEGLNSEKIPDVDLFTPPKPVVTRSKL